MSELNRASRQLLDSAPVPAPSRATRQRLKASVLAVVVPASAAGVGATAGATKSAASFFSSALGKVVAGALATSVGVGGTWAVQQAVHQARAPAPQRQLSHARSGAAGQAPPERASPEAEAAPGALPVEAAPSLPAPSVGARSPVPQLGAAEARLPPASASPTSPPSGAPTVTGGGAAPSPLAQTPEVPPVGGAVRPREATAPPPAVPPAAVAAPPPPMLEADVQLKEELALLHAAMAHRDASDWPSVLKVLEAYEARFPRGKLAHEAAALRVLGLCGVSRVTEAREAAQRLAAAAPGSPTLRSLAGSCAAP